MSALPGLLLTRDLIFSTKVAGTAQALGLEMLVASQLDDAARQVAARRLGCVLLDLAEQGLDVSAVVQWAGDAPVLAYGSHVDRERLQAARVAGCQEVLPRSRFSAQLPEILRRYLASGGAE